MHAPLRRLMERKIVAQVCHPTLLCNSLFGVLITVLQTPHTLSAPNTNLQLDILMGRDETIDVSDIFLGEFISPAFLAVRY
jgi:proteasome maturation protein